jgi:HD-GYP domain-containing protein (c-di-GMP phosphodiesterase class II)
MAESDKKDVVKIIAEFVAAVTNLSLYPPTHPQVAPLVDRLYDSLTRVFEEVPELTLFIVDDDIVAHGKPLPNAGPAGKSFVKLLKKKGIERITLLTGLPKSQLAQFLGDLAAGDVKSIAARSCIKLGKVAFEGLSVRQSDSAEKSRTPADEVAEFLSFREREITELKTLYHGIRVNKRLDIGEVKNLVAEFIDKFKKEMNPLSLLASLKSSDEYTYVHATNVALLTMSLAEFLGFSGSTLEDIGVAALLHDVGKMVIPDEILNKTGALNTDERAVMETHTIRGGQYLVHQKNVSKLTLLAALEHHIKFDGTGYPSITKNWRPNIVSQMISVADVFDALRSRRPYREPLSQEKITAILHKDSGSAFNPALVENFLVMIEQ